MMVMLCFALQHSDNPNEKYKTQNTTTVKRQTEREKRVNYIVKQKEWSIEQA